MGLGALTAAGCGSEDTWSDRLVALTEPAGDTTAGDATAGTTSGPGTTSGSGTWGDSGGTSTTGGGEEEGSTGEDPPCCCEPDDSGEPQVELLGYPGECRGEVGSSFETDDDMNCTVTHEFQSDDSCHPRVECYPCAPSTLPAGMGAVCAAESPCIHMIGD